VLNVHGVHNVRQKDVQTAEPLMPEVGGTCGTHGGGERCLQRFGWRSEGKRPLGRPRLRWDDNITLDLGETGINGSNLIRLAQNRVQWRAFVNTMMKLRVP
jgi:hypothetical protein